MAKEEQMRGSRANFHPEGGKESRPKAVKLQLRPDALAR
jgi:hypothetical protein